MKTIKRLWSGNVQPGKGLGENGGEIKELEGLLQRNAKALERVLGKEGLSLFERYTDCVNEYVYLCNEQAFYKGYCLATRLTAEALLQSEADS